MRRSLFLLATAATIAAPAAVQAAEQPASGAPQPHHDENPDIIVTAPYVRQLDILAGTSVLTGDELQREVRPQIGDSLTSLPGVSATSFTPGASRPVLRGFQGERIRVLTDGIGAIDVSNTSADHAVTIDPLTAERIEVLQGPAVLLFGSQAIGGAVNVIDRRIPRSIPDGGAHGDIVALYGSAADERSLGGAVDMALGGGFVLHADGSIRKTDDLEIGGRLLSPPLRRELLEIAAEERSEGHEEEAEEALEFASRRDVIPNSAVEQKSAGVGLSLIRDSFRIGGSVSLFDTDYGVPMRPGSGHHHGDEEEEGHEGEEEHGSVPVSIGLEQLRLDLRGEYDFASGPFEIARLRIGAADYEHTEFEGDEVGTVFKSDGAEARFELVQRERDGWSGASGIQYFRRSLDAIGEEAFVPPNTTSQWGLFTLQEVELGRFSVEAAGRIERSQVRARAPRLERSFNAFSLAVGGSYEIDPRTRAGVNLSRTERAPSAEELFANGPHVATQAFEVGDPDLAKEKSWGAEAYLRVDKSAFTFSATAFVNRFDDFIYQVRTGEEEDGLPVFAHRQDDATYLGLEGEVSARLFEAQGFRFIGDIVADYVRASVAGGDPVPRIPPLRLLGGVEAQSSDVDARLEVEWTADQDRVSDNEFRTDGFTFVNASIVWRPWDANRETSLMLSANNIFDVEARRHASFTKDFVPLAGRDIRLSAHLAF